jgi:hypothetical protein
MVTQLKTMSGKELSISIQNFKVSVNGAIIQQRDVKNIEWGYPFCGYCFRKLVPVFFKNQPCFYMVGSFFLAYTSGIITYVPLNNA